MISPQGVKGDNHLFKEELWGSHQQTWGGHLEKSASGWWRDQRTKKEEWEVKPPPPHPSSLSALQPLKRHWCCVKSNHKRETLGEHGRNDAMKGWRRRGCRGLVLERRACVWVGSFGGFFLHLSHLESLVSLVPCSLVHNSSAVTQQILVSKRDSEGKILHRCGLTSRRFSARFLWIPPESSALSFVLIRLLKSWSRVYFSLFRAQICTHTTCLTHILALPLTTACLPLSLSYTLNPSQSEALIQIQTHCKRQGLWSHLLSLEYIFTIR